MAEIFPKQIIRLLRAFIENVEIVLRSVWCVHYIEEYVIIHAFVHLIANLNEMNFKLSNIHKSQVAR